MKTADEEFPASEAPSSSAPQASPEDPSVDPQPEVGAPAVTEGVISLERFCAALMRTSSQSGGKKAKQHQPSHTAAVKASILRGLVQSGTISNIMTPSAWAEALRAALQRPTR